MCAQRWCWMGWGIIASLVIPGWVQGEDVPEAIAPAEVQLGRPVTFDDVLPILEAKCQACHNSAIMESRLDLEDVAGMLRGGRRGPAVIPKQPDQSLLYRVAARSAQPVMPPLPNQVEATPLTPQELGLLRQWILEGAAPGKNKPPLSITWQPVPAHLVSIYSVALEPWARFVACSRANQIDVYDLVLGQHVARLYDPLLSTLHQGDQPLYPHGAAHQDFIYALAFHPAGNLLASGGFREIKWWARSTQPVGQFTIDIPPSLAACVSEELIVVATADHQLHLRRWPTGDTVRSWQAHAAPITAIVPLPETGRMISAGRDGLVKVWSLADATLLTTLATRGEIVDLLAMTDREYMLSLHADGIVRVWPVNRLLQPPADPPAEETPVAEWKELGQPVRLGRVPQQPQVVLACADGHWRLAEVPSGNVVRAQQHGAPVTGLAISPDGQHLATVAGDSVKLWKLDGQQLAEIKGSPSAQRQLQQLTEDDLVAKSRVSVADASFKAAEKLHQERDEQTKKDATVRADAEKKLAEAREKEQALQQALDVAVKELQEQPDHEERKKKKAEAETALQKHKEELQKAQQAFDNAHKAWQQSERGQQLAAQALQAAQQKLQLEQAAAQQAAERLQQAQQALPQTVKPVRGVRFLNAQRLATIGEDGALRTWHVPSGKPLDEYLHAETPPVGIASCSPHQVLTWGGAHLTLWDADPPWQLVARLGPPADDPLNYAASPLLHRVLCLAFSPDGRWLASGGGEPSRSGELILWDVVERRVARTFPDAHSDTVFDVEFSRDARWIASGAADKFAKLHDVDGGQLLRAFEGHTHHVLGVALKADASRLATAGADNAIKIWSTETGDQLRTIQNYARQVTSIQYIGISDNLVSGSGDKSVKFHRAGDGGNYRTFGGANDYIHATAASRDETLVVAGGEDGVLRIWNGQNGQLLFSFEPPKPPMAQPVGQR
ncbi:MAG: hypothetical protein KatS3mg114_1435 [Planctomycetaceae bacterium]|nr:MAG: hypothetical protein KatS3mg114_1435 [Planctomycetaceae bacterium]